MTKFSCKACGETISRDVKEVKDIEMLDYILPTYRLIDASDGQDSVPEGFYVYDEEKDLYRLNIEDSKSQLIDSDDLPAGCCGIPWSEENNLECSKGHKIGRKVSDCYTKHSYYLDPEKVNKESTKEVDIENSDNKELLSALENKNEQDRKRAVFILVARDKREELSKNEREKVLNSLEQLIRAESADNHTKTVLIKSLIELDSSRKQILKEKLEESNSKEIRKTSVLSFKHPTEQEVIQELLSIIKTEEDPTVRLALAKKISQNSNKKIIDRLGELLSKDIESENRASIADTLGRIRTNESDAVLIENLDVEEENVKASVVRNIDTSSISKEDSELYSKLINLLQNDSEIIRQASISSLRDMRLRTINREELQKSVPILIDCLSDKNGYVRGESSYILEQIGDKKTIKKLKQRRKEISDEKAIKKIDETIEKIDNYPNPHLYWKDYLQLAGTLILYSPWIIYNIIKVKIDDIR